MFAFHFEDSIALESQLQRACKTASAPALLAGGLLLFFASEGSIAIPKSGSSCSLRASIAIEHPYMFIFAVTGFLSH